MLVKFLTPTVIKLVKNPEFTNVIKKEIIEPNFFKYLTAGLIAPHGITDYIHACNNNNLKNLNLINIISVLLFYSLHYFKKGRVINSLFITSSIIHFRRDFHIINNKFIQFLLSSIIVYVNIFSDKIIYFYLTLFHVPNHYINVWNHLLVDKYRSFFIISLFTFVSLISSYYLVDEIRMKNNLLKDILKGFIMAHVIYQEKFVHNI
tara:strand:- start:89 stop:706 length:618 start_codon:yes stop_codon:yes gene_type:complete